MAEKKQIEAIQKFQCIGCGLGGPGPKQCSSFMMAEGYWVKRTKFYHCQKHTPGTFIAGCGKIYLGLPRGFNKIGAINASDRPERSNNIFIFEETPFYDEKNIPVWTMISEDNKWMFVRVYQPRINMSQIHIIELDPKKVKRLGVKAFLPCGTHNVRDFYDSID